LCACHTGARIEKKKTQNVRHRRLQIDEQAKAAVVGFQFRYNKKI